MEHITIQKSRSLRTLYFVRTVVQIVWAVLVFASLDNPARITILLVSYPLWDVACTLYDLKTSDAAQGSRLSLVVNVISGLVTALVVALTASTQPSYAIAAFGAWALVAGALQLISALARRKQLGGQWAMILSGAQSSLAGVAFFLGGLSGKLHAKDLAGYAVFGAIYFCVAGILLSRKLTQNSLTNDPA